jgi:phosphoribosylglycinamide formyltransferase-1
LHAAIAVVISNTPDAAGLERAQAAGIETAVMPHKQWPTRDAYDRALVETLREHGVRLVCLAGFMRLLGPPFVDAFPNAILNVHPSLLPAFPGVDAQRQAVEHGARISGATVHLVTADLDAGPIILQAAVPVLPDDTAATLAARILVEEHRLYPEAIRLMLGGGWQLEGRRFVITRASQSD